MSERVFARERAGDADQGVARGSVPGGVGGGGDQQPAHALVGPRLLHAEGRRRPAPLRALPRAGPPRALRARGRHAGAGLRRPRRVPRARASTSSWSSCSSRRAWARSSSPSSSSSASSRPRASSTRPASARCRRFRASSASSPRPPARPSATCCNVIGRRFADLRILITPVRVQGEEAPGEIVRGARRPPGDRGPRRGDRGPRRRLHRGPLGLQRRAGGPRHRGLPRARHLRGGPRDRLHHRRLRGRPARAHAVGGRRAGGAGEAAGGPRARASSTTRLKQAMAAEVERERERVDCLARRRVLTDPARALRDLHRRLDELHAPAPRPRGAEPAPRTAHRVALATNTLRSLIPCR